MLIVVGVVGFYWQERADFKLLLEISLPIRNIMNGLLLNGH